MKSPHAYLTLAPTLQLQNDYHVAVKFLPYQLDFVQMGISLKHEADGVRHSPDEHADRRARMFYAVAREYATLQGLQLRGPPKLLHSRFCNLGLLYASNAGLEIPYLKTVFDAGWPNGWREYDMEDPAVIQDTLQKIGVPSVDQFTTIFVTPGGPGDQSMQQLAVQAEARGCAM